MSRINSLLENLLSAVYGRDVRQSIHDSIKECYDDVTTGKTMAEKAAGAANTAASTANSAATNANTAADNANAAAENANHLGLTVIDGKLCVEVERE